jgi:hypothetical protein
VQDDQFCDGPRQRDVEPVHATGLGGDDVGGLHQHHPVVPQALDLADPVLKPVGSAAGKSTLRTALPA